LTPFIFIFDYLKLYRIFQASLKICNENSGTITETAFSCGYNSLSSFYSDFKDIFSMTPKDFKLKK
jgi:AraC-like DNA-binding protein